MGPPAPSANETFVIERNVAVPMRDGVVLRADLIRPQGEGRYPVLVYRTPYDKDEAPKAYATFSKAAARGYAVIIQDVRGRYHSDGEFDPYRHEGRDGYDTIEWAARQPWSNGAVGTFGLSYPGAVQWLAAMESPPHLKAMVPAMTFSTPRNFFYYGGVFDLSWTSWIWNNIAPDVRARKNLPGPRTYAEAEASWGREHSRVESHLPLSTLPDFKDIAPWYYEWLRHPPTDAWWDWAELRGKYDRVTAAVLNLSGWNDEAYGPEGATTNFQGLIATRSGRKDPGVHLILGPWMHGVANTGRTKFGEREFGPAAAIDYDETVLRFLDHYVRGIENGVEKEKPVRYFVMGENVWRESGDWPPPTTPLSVYLSGPANTRSRGALRLKPPQQPGAAGSSEVWSTFDSDPPAPLTDPYGDTLGAHDYRSLKGQENVLLFDSAPLAQDVEVTGRIAAEIFLSAPVPDLDLWVRLLDVAPDGTAYNLMSPGLDVMRASYRSGTQRELTVHGVIFSLRLENLITSNRFLKGHRLRVQISSAFAPHFSRNLQTGQLEMDSSESIDAEISVDHAPAFASRIILPVAGSAKGIEDAVYVKTPAEMGARPGERGHISPPLQQAVQRALPVSVRADPARRPRDLEIEFRADNRGGSQPSDSAPR
jgi:putative CocE/NonD family hydrolase